MRAVTRIVGAQRSSSPEAGANRSVTWCLCAVRTRAVRHRRSPPAGGRRESRPAPLQPANRCACSSRPCHNASRCDYGRQFNPGGSSAHWGAVILDQRALTPVLVTQDMHLAAVERQVSQAGVGRLELESQVRFHKSMTTSPIGCEQHTRRLPSAGFSSGSGP
jgi:hypothetical protein